MKWQRWHKWLGLGCALFVVLFSLSGLVLNHRSTFADCEVSRRWLPPRYAYEQWRGGLLRGTLRLEQGCVLIYGANGMWITDTLGRGVRDANQGLPASADQRQVRQVIEARGMLFALTPAALYQNRQVDGGTWQRVELPTLSDNERLTDVVDRGDTLVVLTRSRLLVSVASGAAFSPLNLSPAPDSDGRVTLFRTVWMLHSGELFGTIGRLVVDGVAMILIGLSLTGVLFTVLPPLIRQLRHSHRKVKRPVALLRQTGWLHNRMGRITLVLTLWLVATGWFLRPPLMIPLVLTRTPPLLGTSLDSPNPWHDRLRLVRYDARRGDWLLSTSEGFYSLSDLRGAVPHRLTDTPPVSVMGLNVWQSDAQGRWLCGSFSGLYVWDRTGHRSTDWFTGQPAPAEAGSPVGQRAVSGFSADFAVPPFAVEYDRGTDAIAQPDRLRYLPMSLWNVALELHSGRLYVGQSATYFFIFVMGGAILGCLWSGWKMRRH